MCVWISMYYYSSDGESDAPSWLVWDPISISPIMRRVIKKKQFDINSLPTDTKLQTVSCKTTLISFSPFSPTRTPISAFTTWLHRNACRPCSRRPWILLLPRFVATIFIIYTDQPKTILKARHVKTTLMPLSYCSSVCSSSSTQNATIHGKYLSRVHVTQQVYQDSGMCVCCHCNSLQGWSSDY